MKTLLRILFFAVLIFSGLCDAVTYSNKTYLSSSSSGFDKAMTHSAWAKHAYQKYYLAEEEQNINIKSYFQATPFYKCSTNDAEIGKYFGINGKNSFSVGRARTETFDGADVPGSFLIHNRVNMVNNVVAEEIEGSLSFNPKLETFGTRFNYLQELSGLLQGFYFQASFPFVYIKNDMKSKIETKEALAISEDLLVKKYTLKDFFAGRINVNSGGNLQNSLTHGKIDGSRHTAGLADLDLSLGYQLCSKPNRYCTLSFDSLIPTGNKPTAEYLYEPIYGNAGHFGIGGSVNGGALIFEQDSSQIWFHVGTDYKYLCEGTEKRLPGIKNLEKIIPSGSDLKLPDNKIPFLRESFAHYFLSSKRAKFTADRGLFPLANVLAQDFRVKPGSRFEALFQLSFFSKQIGFDLGYDFSWKDKESVWIKKSSSFDAFIVSDNFTVSKSEKVILPSNILQDQVDSTDFIRSDNIDIDSIKTPSQLKHQFFGSLSYNTHLYKKYPLDISCGMSCDVAQNNALHAQYGIWLKATTSF